MHHLDEIEQRYATFLEQFRGNITRFCIYYSNNCNDAEDLMQEIFAAIWVNLPKLQADCTPRQANRWLYKLMFYVWFKHLRNSRQPKHMPQALLEKLEYSDHDSESRAELAALLEELAAYLTEEDDRILVEELRQGYTAAEIAQRYSYTIGATRTRISRLKDKLKTIYDKLYGTQH